MESQKSSIYKQPIFNQIHKKTLHRDDGLLLTIHHTTPGPSGDIRRTQFIFASFNCSNEHLALADHRENIFVVDLTNSVFWLLRKQISLSLLCFDSHRHNHLFVGTEDAGLMVLDAETNQQLGTLVGHSEAPISVSFSSDGNYCLSATNGEGFIWDLRTLSQAHRLNLQPGMTIKQAMFMPVSNNILACFQDDAIHIWAFPSFQCIKQIVPDSWKGRDIRSIAFTRDGHAMVIGGVSRQLVIFTIDNWDAQRVVVLPNIVSEVHHIEFLPQSFESGANQVLLVMSDSGQLFLVDLSKDMCSICKSTKDIRTFACSCSGKYIVCNTASGEAKIFSGSKFLTNVISAPGGENWSCFEESSRLELPVVPSSQPKRAEGTKKHLVKKYLSEVNAVLDVNRLRLILKEFLGYPEQYRGLIWRSILQLPGNKEPWKSLSQRPLHPAAQILSETYQLQNKIVLSCLQSVISCLAHWSPVFGELPYLPHFLCPFVKVFHSDKFLCFEVAVTLIINWCQLWFEYLSFPPVNILCIVENILLENDTGLVSFFRTAGVTSNLYAWTILSSAFSEVLTADQWKQLWDHIVSNPPWFLLFAVAAYNICCRTSLKTCSTKQDFEFFFRNQNPIDMKYFIKTCYELMEKTSGENNPKQLLRAFTPLPKGNYPVFSEFPIYVVNFQKEQRDTIREEEEKILREQHAILSQRLARERTRFREQQARIHEARLLEAEKAAKASLHTEETRLNEKRQQLAALRRELRLQEEQASATARVEAMEHQIKQRSAELERLYLQLHEKAEQAGLDRENINEEFHEQFNRLNTKKKEMKVRLNELNLSKFSKQCFEDVPSYDILHLKEQQRLLREEISKLREENRNHGIKASDVDFKMAELDILTQKVDVALARRALLQECNAMDAEQRQDETLAAAKLKKLQSQVEELTQKLMLINSKAPNAIPESVAFEGNLFTANKSANYKYLQSDSGPIFFRRNSDTYKTENCVVSSAMSVRKSLLSDWSAS